MTPEENALLARLDGRECYIDGKYCYLSEDNSKADYDDERLLMPLAFDKCHINLSTEFDNVDVPVWIAASPYYEDVYVENKSWKEAIQQALLAIAREKYDE